jgi:hypothetical protein
MATSLKKSVGERQSRVQNFKLRRDPVSRRSELFDFPWPHLLYAKHTELAA